MVEKSLSRALRRHHVERLKRNRRFYFGADQTQFGHALSMLVSTAAPCSCWMCGNPRRYLNELTVQERRMFQDVIEGR